MRTLLFPKSNNLQLQAVFAMILSGIVSAGVVVMDFDRPEYYQLLWTLPIVFSMNCFLLYPIRKLLFTRISVTIIVGFYWIRMVVSPICMVLGDYAVVAEVSGNTSWQNYLDKAFLLASYESVFVFFAVFVSSKLLNCDNYAPRREGGTRLGYSALFYNVFLGICAFFFGMIILYPELIRYRFITILGAPDGWAIRELGQRSLDGSGRGPLGILVTMWCYLIVILQFILPPVLLTWILNKKKKWTSHQIVFAAFLLIGCVAFISTESRGFSVVAALALMITLMSYSDKKQLRLEIVILMVLGVLAIGGLWYKTKTSGRLLEGKTDFQILSMMITSYFSGPQSIAASIEATEQMGGPNFMLLLSDMNLSIPYLGTILHQLGISIDLPAANILFNRVLYGASDLTNTDQIVPAVGQGCMYFGFLLAPLIPVTTTLAAAWFEGTGRRAKVPVLKNICYVGAVLMSYCQVPNNIAIGMTYLWYVTIAVLVTVPGWIRGKRIVKYE